jgi:hypothetical protein
LAHIIAWKLCTTMRVENVTDTLNLALTASGCDRATVYRRPRLTPADIYFGRGQTILLQRERIKRKTIEQRRLRRRRDAA